MEHAYYDRLFDDESSTLDRNFLIANVAKCRLFMKPNSVHFTLGLSCYVHYSSKTR